MLKSLIVFHRLMRESEGASFVAELLRYSHHTRGHRGHALNMDNFVDGGSAEGRYVLLWLRLLRYGALGFRLQLMPKHTDKTAMVVRIVRAPTKAAHTPCNTRGHAGGSMRP